MSHSLRELMNESALLPDSAEQVCARVTVVADKLQNKSEQTRGRGNAQAADSLLSSANDLRSAVLFVQSQAKKGGYTPESCDADMEQLQIRLGKVEKLLMKKSEDMGRKGNSGAGQALEQAAAAVNEGSERLTRLQAELASIVTGKEGLVSQLEESLDLVPSDASLDSRGDVITSRMKELGKLYRAVGGHFPESSGDVDKLVAAMEEELGSGVQRKASEDEDISRRLVELEAEKEEAEERMEQQEESRRFLEAQVLKLQEELEACKQSSMDVASLEERLKKLSDEREKETGAVESVRQVVAAYGVGHPATAVEKLYKLDLRNQSSALDLRDAMTGCLKALERSIEVIADRSSPQESVATKVKSVYEYCRSSGEVEECESCESQLEAIEGFVSHLVGEKEELEQAKGHEEELEDCLRSIEKQLEERQEQLRESQVTIKQLEEQVEVTAARVESGKEEGEGYQEQVSFLETRLKETEEQFAKYKSRSHAALKKVEKRAELLNGMRKENEKLVREAEESRVGRKEAEEEVQKAERRVGQVTELWCMSEEEVEEYRRLYRVEKKALEEAKIKTEKVAKEMDQIMAKCRELEKKLSEVVVEKEKLQVEKEGMRTLEQNVEEKERERRELEKSFKDAQRRVSEVESNVDERKEHVKKLETRLGELLDQETRWKEEKVSRRNLYKQLEETEEEILEELKTYWDDSRVNTVLLALESSKRDDATESESVQASQQVADLVLEYLEQKFLSGPGEVDLSKERELRKQVLQLEDKVAELEEQQDATVDEDEMADFGEIQASRQQKQQEQELEVGRKQRKDLVSKFVKGLEDAVRELEEQVEEYSRVYRDLNVWKKDEETKDVAEGGYEEEMVFKSGVVVKAGSSFDLPIVCPTKGHRLVWSFTVVEDDKDLSFKLESDKASEALVPDERVSALNGVHVVEEKDSTFHFVWDNSFSWLSNKTLEYHVSVERRKTQEEVVETAISNAQQQSEQETRARLAKLEEELNARQILLERIESVNKWTEEKEGYCSELESKKRRVGEVKSELQTQMEGMKKRLSMAITEEDDMDDDRRRMEKTLAEATREKEDAEMTLRLSNPEASDQLRETLMKQLT